MFGINEVVLAVGGLLVYKIAEPSAHKVGKFIAGFIPVEEPCSIDAQAIEAGRLKWEQQRQAAATAAVQNATAKVRAAAQEIPAMSVQPVAG